MSKMFSKSEVKFSPEDHQHCRFNPLRDEWVLVSPHRIQRPWEGKLEKDDYCKKIPTHDPKNPLCPRAKRPTGEVNPDYRNTFVFDNDFPALLESGPAPEKSADDLFQMGPAKGICRVMCFHPITTSSLPLMSIEDIIKVIDKWIDQFNELTPKYRWIQIFENKGEIMGCSNPHPHCQIWASTFLPNEARLEDRTQREYLKGHQVPMLQDYLKKEISNKVRIILSNDTWVVLVPFWAVWPYETLILPKRHLIRMSEINKQEKCDLAEIMKLLLIKYDNLFQTPMPYTGGWHGAPTGDLVKDDNKHWVLHAHFYPPLLRSAHIKKFMVGYEMLAQVQRDLTPEKAASVLKELPNFHYAGVTCCGALK